MIHINLAGEKVDYRAPFVAHIAALSGAVLLSLAVCAMTHSAITGELNKVQGQKTYLDQTLAQLKQTTAIVAGLEANKKLLKEKLSTIATLKINKRGPVKIIDTINDATPERAWLTSVKQKESSLEILGVAVDNQTIADFMANIKKSSLFGDPELVQSKHFVREEVPVKEFTLRIPLVSSLTLASKQVQGKAGANMLNPNEMPTPPKGKKEKSTKAKKGA